MAVCLDIKLYRIEPTITSSTKLIIKIKINNIIINCMDKMLYLNFHKFSLGTTN